MPSLHSSQKLPLKNQDTFVHLRLIMLLPKKQVKIIANKPFKMKTAGKEFDHLKYFYLLNVPQHPLQLG